MDATKAERLYYTNPSLLQFEANVTSVEQHDGRIAIFLDQSAFYPTSGGQVFDTGYLQANGSKLRVEEVAEDESGRVCHFISGTADAVRVGDHILAMIDADRRLDHTQQHSGQHVLSAAFEHLFDMPTVSFHMGDESCTIDLDTKGISPEQLKAAEHEANRVVFENLPVSIKFASADDARSMGVRKIPAHVEGELRLIYMQGYDLNACGGTHVRATGEIGPILLRKVEKVRQGFRVEFVCGFRALTAARHDFELLTEAAGRFGTQISEVPELIGKAQEELKANAKERKHFLEEIAELSAAHWIASTPVTNGFRLIVKSFQDRDLSFIKLLAQKITAAAPSIVLFGARSGQPGVVFAQSRGLTFDMGALMKEALPLLGGRGGGNRDMAQGGASKPEHIDEALAQASANIAR